MKNNDELIQHLREAIDYIESMQDSIETTVSDSAADWIYNGMDKSLEFDIKAAKSLIEQLEAGNE